MKKRARGAIGSLVSKRRGALVLVALVFFSGAAVGAGVSVTTLDSEELDLGEASLQSADVEVADYDLAYDGDNVTAVEVTLNNTVSAERTGDVYADLTDASGATVGDGSAAGVTLAADERTTVTIAISQEPTVENVANVTLRFEQA